MYPSLSVFQELIHYLTRIHRQWSDIMEGYSPDLLDPHTVTLLETLMPDCSLHDRACIEDMMEQRRIFLAVESRCDRQEIMHRVLSTNGRILSFYTFSRDFFYFEACATSLRKLLPSPLKQTVSGEFMHSYRGTNQHPGLYRIQTRETAFHQHSGSRSMNPILGYRQLFLAVMRDFPVLSNLAPYRDLRKLKQGRHGIESESLFKLAWLAFELGFENRQMKEVLEWAGENSGQAVARDFLRQIRPPMWYVVDHGKADDIASYVGSNLPGMASPPASRGQPKFTTNLETQSKRFRCSRPSSKHYVDDRKFLFIDIMYNYNPIPQAHVTSLAIQRDIFVSYFGEFDLPPLSDGSPVTNPRSPANSTTTGIAQMEESELAQETEFSIGERYLSRSQDRMNLANHPEARIELRSPSFVTTSVSTATSAPEMRSDFYNLDFLSDNAADPENTAMNEFHYINSPNPSLIVKEILSEAGVIVIYAWEKKEYAKFSADAQQRSIFENFACDLADQMQYFLIPGDLRIYSPPLSSLWDAACRGRLVLVGSKPRRSDPGESLRFLVGRDPYIFIDLTSKKQANK